MACKEKPINTSLYPKPLKTQARFLNAGSLSIKSKGGQTFQRFPLRRRSRSLAAQLDSVTPELLQQILLKALLSEGKKTPPICQKHTPPSQTQHSISSISRKSLGGKPIMLISQESEATSLGRVFYWSNICYPHRNHFPLKKKKTKKKKVKGGAAAFPAGGRRILRPAGLRSPHRARKTAAAPRSWHRGLPPPPARIPRPPRQPFSPE